MYFSAISAAPDSASPSRRSRRPATRNRLYKAVALLTTFAMLFGGLLLMTPMPAAAASAVTTSRLNLRSGPGLDYDVLTVIPDGASISVDGDAEAGYLPVTWNGTSGYAASEWIQIGGVPSGDSDSEEPPVSGGAPTGTAWVATDRLNFRSGPSLNDSVIAVLENGRAVELTGQQSNGYWQANAAGTTGWLASEYLTTSGAPSTPDTGSDAGSGAVPVGDSVTGSATVTSGLNLRQGPGTGYSVVTVMPSGASVDLRGSAQGEYYPVAYNGSTGWAHMNWLSIGGSAPSPSPDTGNGSVAVGDTATGSAKVTANLNLRQGPSTGYSVVTVMPSGATVELRGDAQSGYYPLSYNGTTGWAAADWLTVGSAAPEPAPGGSDDGAVAVGDSVTGSATVTSALNLRSGPGLDYQVRTVMPSGASVELRGDAQGSYYPVAFNGTTGWAHGDWLDTGGSSPSPAPDTGNGSVPVPGTATGSASTSAALNLRTGPATSYDVVTVMPLGASVELRGDAQDGFYPLSYNGTTGWAHGDWLIIGNAQQPDPTPAPTPEPTPAPTPDPDPAPAPGDGSYPDYLYTETAVNMRSQPTTDSSVVWVIPPGTRVTITGPLQNGWYPTAWAHVSGYMFADLLVPELSSDVPSDQQWIVDIIYAAADRYGQPREDMLRVAQCESHLDPNAVNPVSGTSGLFQFRPSTWATTPYADQDIFDATANANAAAWMWSVGRRNEWACQ